MLPPRYQEDAIFDLRHANQAMLIKFTTRENAVDAKSFFMTQVLHWMDRRDNKVQKLIVRFERTIPVRNLGRAISGFYSRFKNFIVNSNTWRADSKLLQKGGTLMYQDEEIYTILKAVPDPDVMHHQAFILTPEFLNLQALGVSDMSIVDDWVDYSMTNCNDYP